MMVAISTRNQPPQPPDRRSVGALIRQHRVRAGLSEDDAADLIGVRRSAVTEIEAGIRRLPPHRLHLVVEHLSVPHAILLEEWIGAEGRATLSLPPDAHPLAAQVFVSLVQSWPDLAIARSPLARGTLAVMRWALVRFGQTPPKD